MRFERTLFMGLSLLALAACNGSGSGAPDDINGTYTLVSENGQALPADPSAPNGCCLTLGGSVTLANGAYDLRTSHRNKTTQEAFENSEKGTFTRSGNRLNFTRTSGGGIGQPYLLAPGVVDGNTLTLLYGDEGPGSNQTRAVFVALY